MKDKPTLGHILAVRDACDRILRLGVSMLGSLMKVDVRIDTKVLVTFLYGLLVGFTLRHAFVWLSAGETSRRYQGITLFVIATLLSFFLWTNPLKFTPDVKPTGEPDEG